MLPPPPPQWRRWIDVEAVFAIWAICAGIVLAPNFFVPTDFPHQPGDGWPDLGKVYVAMTSTWLIWRASRRSLDRGGRT